MGPSDDVDLSRMIERELAMLARRVDKLRRVMTLPDGTTLDRSAYLLLDHIDTDPAPTLGSLGATLQLDQSTVNRQVGALERDQLVERVAGADGVRAAQLRVTSRGRKQLNAARKLRASRVAHGLAGWSAKDRATLGRLLERLNAALAAE
ncbi:MAG TPA: MarR family winged helix-turn-helix transcriptional regulator [Acidimicrobiales bacterium]|jgi:DNA-binding MarR family transcriptional regulator